MATAIVLPCQLPLSLSALPLCLISAHRSPLLSTSLERQRSGSSWGTAIVRPPVSQRQAATVTPFAALDSGAKGRRGRSKRSRRRGVGRIGVCECTNINGRCGEGRQTNKQTKRKKKESAPRGRLRHGIMGVSINSMPRVLGAGIWHCEEEMSVTVLETDTFGPLLTFQNWLLHSFSIRTASFRNSKQTMCLRFI